VVGDTTSWDMFKQGLHKHCEEGTAPAPTPKKPPPDSPHPSGPSRHHGGSSEQPQERVAWIPWYSMVGSLLALMLVVGFFLVTEAQSVRHTYSFLSPPLAVSRRAARRLSSGALRGSTSGPSTTE
jgi:hypothetical protein